MGAWKIDPVPPALLKVQPSTRYWCFVLPFGILLLLRAPSFPQQDITARDAEGKSIQNIQANGLQRLSPGDVIARMGLKVGEPFREEDYNNEYQRLWRSGEFLLIEDELEVDGDGVTIIFTFQEKQRVAEVVFEGNDSVDRTQLEGDLRTRRGGLLNPYEVLSDTRLLINLYRQKGFNFVRVEQLVNERPQGTEVTFRIIEGPKVRVEEIRFKGNHSFPAKELRRQMATRARIFFFGGVFDFDVVLTDVDRLKSFYRRKGFLDVKVAAEDFAFNFARDRLYLGIRVDEGPRYLIANIEFDVIDGEGVFGEEELRREITVQPGTPYDGDRVQDDGIRILRLYQNRAYIHARLDPRIEHRQAGNEITLIYRIQQGPEVYIESIEIRGNLETRDKVIRRELAFYPGEKIKIDRWQESKSNLIRLRYFEGIPAIIPEPGSTNNQAHVVVDVEEGSTGQLLFGFGVTSGLGAIGNISIVKRNFDITDLPESFWDIPSAFTGAGQTLIIEAQPGTEFSRYQATFIEPYLWDTPTSVTLRGFQNTFSRLEYVEDRISGRFGIGRRFLEKKLRLDMTYRYEIIEIKDLEPNAPPDAFAVRGTNRLSGLGASLTYDRRRFAPLVGPVSGYEASVGYEYTGGFLGADIDIQKLSANVSVYRTLHTDTQDRAHILGIRNVIQWVEEHHNTNDVPIFERYFLGGARTVRGFRFLELGPHQNGEPVGGNAAHYGSAEYTFPIFSDFLRGVTFMDFGNLAEDLDAYESNEYRLTVGGGIIINVNLLGQRVPITLTWGEALLDEPEDRTRLFLFDIGRLGF